MAPKCLILFLLLLCGNFLDFSMQQLVQSPPCFGARASPVPGVAGGCCCSTQLAAGMDPQGFGWFCSSPAGICSLTANYFSDLLVASQVPNPQQTQRKCFEVTITSSSSHSFAHECFPGGCLPLNLPFSFLSLMDGVRAFLGCII